VDQQT